MNSLVLYGKLMTLPKISIIQIDGKSILVGKFVVGCLDENRSADYFECIAFGNTVRIIKRSIEKGSCVTVFGSMKNFIFQDVNKTNHYTNVLLAEQIDNGKKEYELVQGDVNLEVEKLYNECSDYLKKCYQQVCENGFLCVSEDDYYDIATSNFIMT